MVHTSVPWRYEVQQIDILEDGGLSTAELYISLEGPDNDTAIGSYLNGTSWPITGASLLNPMTSAEDLAAALSSLPVSGEVSVVRVPAVSIRNASVASRHLVTFISRGGDIPLLVVKKSVVTGTKTSNGTRIYR